MSLAGAADIAEICRRLDGIPLAIELAAAQVPHFSPHQTSTAWATAWRRSTGRREPARHRSLHGALDWSHALLEDEERAVFRRLAVFPGQLQLDAAQAICGERTTLEPLLQLQRKP